MMAATSTVPFGADDGAADDAGGGVAAGFAPCATRELVIPRTPYIVPYRFQRAVIQVLRVYHGARRWPESF
jgi:plasmid stabilization system protein ParE